MKEAGDARTVAPPPKRGLGAVLTLLLPVGLFAYTVVITVLVLVGAPTSYRAPLVLLFIGVGPGAAVVRLLHIPGILMQLSLAVTVSFALGVLVPSAMLYAGWWSPRAALLVLALVTAVASSAAFVVELRRLRLPARS